MQALVDVILPVFFVIGFGYFAVWKGLFSASGVDGLMVFTQTFAIPCLLFKAIATLDLTSNFQPGLLASFYIAAITCFALGTLGARLLFKRSARDAIAIGFVCLFSNTVLLGLPIMERAYGVDALAANFAIIAFHAPFCYLIGVSAMEVAEAGSMGFAATAKRVLRAMFSNALVIGIALGFFVNTTGLGLPGVVWDAIDLMVLAAIPAALFGLGGVLHRYRPEGDVRTIIMVCVISLAIHPTLVYALAHLFQLTDAQLRSAVVLAAMAPGANTYIFSNIYGAARRVAASSVLFGTAASVITVWIWLLILP